MTESRHASWLELFFDLVVVAIITAAGLGALTAHAHDPAADGIRWLLCGGLAVYFAAVVAGGLFMRHPLHRLAVLTLIAVVLPLLLGFFGHRLLPPALAWLLVLIVAAQVGYAIWDERNSLRRQNG